MILVGKETKKSPAQVLDRAVEYFGPSGLGLELSRRDDGNVHLWGGGGYVAVRAWPKEGSDTTEVEIEGREWERDAEKFLGEI